MQKLAATKKSTLTYTTSRPYHNFARDVSEDNTVEAKGWDFQSQGQRLQSLRNFAIQCINTKPQKWNNCCLTLARLTHFHYSRYISYSNAMCTWHVWNRSLVHVVYITISVQFNKKTQIMKLKVSQNVVRKMVHLNMINTCVAVTQYRHYKLTTL